MRADLRPAAGSARRTGRGRARTGDMQISGRSTRPCPCAHGPTVGFLAGAHARSILLDPRPRGGRGRGRRGLRARPSAGATGSAAPHSWDNPRGSPSRPDPSWTRTRTRTRTRTWTPRRPRTRTRTRSRPRSPRSPTPASALPVDKPRRAPSRSEAAGDLAARRAREAERYRKGLAKTRGGFVAKLARTVPRQAQGRRRPARRRRRGSVHRGHRNEHRRKAPPARHRGARPRRCRRSRRGVGRHSRGGAVAAGTSPVRRSTPSRRSARTCS